MGKWIDRNGDQLALALIILGMMLLLAVLFYSALR
jgi:hypothetical protein